MINLPPSTPVRNKVYFVTLMLSVAWFSGCSDSSTGAFSSGNRVVLKSSDGKQQLVYDCGAFRPQADTSDQIEILLTAAGETMKAAGETQSIITGRALQEAWGKRDYRAMERIIVDYRCNQK